jgi:hypothetical protein
MPQRDGFFRRNAFLTSAPAIIARGDLVLFDRANYKAALHRALFIGGHTRLTPPLASPAHR